MKNYFFIVPLLNFFVAALLGLLLRSAYVFPLSKFNFMYLMHAHSHVAILGWLYLAIYLFFVRFFASDSFFAQRFYKNLFYVTELSILGMLFLFPIQGYAMGSIIFSTLHILCSYLFIIVLWRNNKAKKGFEKLLLKSALAFMFFSTLGVWCLGPAVGLLGKASVFYQIAIQFFLHFQFNGWFMFATLVLLFHCLFKGKFFKRTKFFYILLVSSVFLTFSLPLSWYLKLTFLHYINTIGVLFQVFAFVFLFIENQKILKEVWDNQNLIEKVVLSFGLFSLGLRLLFQVFTVSYSIAIHSQLIRHWTVGFIHLNMLGVISGFIFFILIKKKIMLVNLVSKFGIYIFIASFVATEILLFGEGMLVYINYSNPIPLYSFLFWLSLGLPLGIFLMTIPFFMRKSRQLSVNSEI